MARRAPRSRSYDDEYADRGYARPRPRRRTNTSAIIIGIVVAISVIAVLVKALSGDEEITPEDEQKAIDVARRAVQAGLTRDMANFRRTIDPFAPGGLTSDMGKPDRIRFKEGKPGDEWVDKQWERHLNNLRRVAENDLQLKTAQDVDALFSAVDVEARGALDRVDVIATTKEGVELTILLRKTDDEWRVMRWNVVGNYYSQR